ncbi:flavoprotein [Kibdelosporangium philippinense]|uniref:Flavoprotein n=1 Tax=Kibdelosporangium philippinense TaxID=211113 RepID=A0ABS8ZKD9_9PSEU|nr:flavoprotein [Kibdelosporangium philippinense]MCE7008273.1 flavoprotein [Kibdelosporangium philippinense]
MSAPVVGLVGSAAGGLEEITPKLIQPAIERGLRVAVTLTPTAWTWLDAMGEVDKIEQLTGLPVRYKPRMPWEDSPHPKIDCYAVVPATSNTVAKMALGLADNQALTQVCEAIGLGEVPVVVFPRVNAAHANQPAWDDHIAALTRSGVRLVMGEDIWPLHKPRSAPGKELPWAAILDAIVSAVQEGR